MNRIDLSRLAPPAAIEVFTFDAILNARLADAAARLKAAGTPYNVQTLVGNPLSFTQRADACREGLMRQRVNNAVNATYLAFAKEVADIDARAADFNLTRAPGESNASLRERSMLVWETLTTGGSYGGYKQRALSAAPVELADVAVYGHEATGVPRGEVWIICLGANASGIPSDATLDLVRAQFPRDRRKVNDRIVVKAATIAPYIVDVTLILDDGASPAAVVAQQQTALLALAAARRKIGAGISLDTLRGVLAGDAALVYDLILRAPLEKIGGGPFDAPLLTGSNLLWAPRDE